MLSPISLFKPALVLALMSLLLACGESKEAASPEAQASGIVAGTEAGLSTGPIEEGPTINGSEGTAATEEDVQEIDPESLEPAGKVKLKQYSVAWVGSGTIGGGTLSIDGETYPFNIVGLGVGGFGASSVQATGVVYNLPYRDAFAGTYGNARLGLTAGDSGGGKLWLRNSDGVVIELQSEMRGLALAGGVDGLVIQWEEGDKSTVDDAVDGTEEVVGKGIEAGADAVESGIGKVKGWLKKDGE